MTVISSLLLLVALGLDTLLLSTAIGASNLPGKIRLCAVLALFEGLMPALGVAIGGALGHWFSGAAFWIGIAFTLGIGIYLLFDNDGDELSRFRNGLQGAALLVAGAAVSVDELAVGLSAGLLNLPWAWLVPVLALQSFVFAYIGFTFGRRLKPLLGEWAEKAGGLMLIALAIWFGAERWLS